jgi:hypothetical protein
MIYRGTHNVISLGTPKGHNPDLNLRYRPITQSVLQMDASSFYVHGITCMLFWGFVFSGVLGSIFQ